MGLAEVAERQTRYVQGVVPKRRAGSNPALGTTLEGRAQALVAQIG